MHYTPCRLLQWYNQNSFFSPNRTCMYELWAASYFSLLFDSNRKFSCLVWFLIKIWKQLEYRRKLSKINFVPVNFIFKLQIVTLMSLSKTRSHSSKIFLFCQGSFIFLREKKNHYSSPKCNVTLFENLSYPMIFNFRTSGVNVRDTWKLLWKSIHFKLSCL